MPAHPSAQGCPQPLSEASRQELPLYREGNRASERTKDVLRRHSRRCKPTTPSSLAGAGVSGRRPIKAFQPDPCSLLTLLLLSCLWQLFGTKETSVYSSCPLAFLGLTPRAGLSPTFVPRSTRLDVSLFIYFVLFDFQLVFALRKTAWFFFLPPCLQINLEEVCTQRDPDNCRERDRAVCECKGRSGWPPGFPLFLLHLCCLSFL